MHFYIGLFLKKFPKFDRKSHLGYYTPSSSKLVNYILTNIYKVIKVLG